MSSFNEANQKWHSVENEWHYPMLIKHGFKPLNETAQGFVRKYEWVNDASRKLTYHVGTNHDYWTDSETFWPGGNTLKSHFWLELEPFLKSIQIIKQAMKDETQ